MNRFGFQWPDNLECSRFPLSGLCVGENRTTSAAGGRGQLTEGDDDVIEEHQSPGGDDDELAEIDSRGGFGLAPECPAKFRAAGYHVQVCACGVAAMSLI